MASILAKASKKKLNISSIEEATPKWNILGNKLIQVSNSGNIIEYDLPKSEQQDLFLMRGEIVLVEYFSPEEASHAVIEGRRGLAKVVKSAEEDGSEHYGHSNRWTYKRYIETDENGKNLAGTWGYAEFVERGFYPKGGAKIWWVKKI